MGCLAFYPFFYCIGAWFAAGVADPDPSTLRFVPLYYIGLLVPRQLDDDRRCAAKYGALWTEYQARVPARIIPKIW